MKLDIPMLKADQIEVRIAKLFDNFATALLYKTARTDMDILDSVYGAENWECDYKEIKGNLYCGIGVYIAKSNGDVNLVWKWDCGVESRTDSDNNQKKGEASDAFKRAGFKWGIGRELYSAPTIFLKVNTKKTNGKIELEKSQDFYVEQIDYDNDRKISKLIIKSTLGETVFSWSKSGVNAYEKSKEQPKKEDPLDKLNRDDLFVEVAALEIDVDGLAKFFKVGSVDELTDEQLREGIRIKRAHRK